MLRVGDRLDRQTDGVSCGPSVLLVTAWLSGRAAAPVLGAADQRRAHRQANRLWPRALGTTPWGMRAWLRRHAPAAGRFRIRPASTATLAALPAVPVPLLVGSRLLPRHWVLVVGNGVYEPSSGQVRAFDPAVFDDGRAPGLLGWPRPWCVLLPAPKTVGADS